MVAIMISANHFPEGDAGAIRDYAFAQIYRNLGYVPVVICCNPKEKNGIYKGIPYFSTFSPAYTIKDKFVRVHETGKKVEALFPQIEKEFGKIALIHYYGGAIGSVRYLKKYAEAEDCTLIHDSVEWYSASEFKLGVLDPAYILKDITNRLLIDRHFKVIAISQFLQDYYGRKGINTIRIPVIMDQNEFPEPEIQRSGKIKLIYAGSPANKDFLTEIVDAFMQLTAEEQSHLEFNIYGITSEQLYNLTKPEQPVDCIHAHGRVSHQKVLEALQTSDFSLLLRPSDKRYTKAGFPTKVVEAMSSGVAMICNVTSDLNFYLKDTENAIIVDQCTSESLAKAVKCVLLMNDRQIMAIRHNARMTAKNHFDYHSYCESVRRLIGDKSST